MKHRSEATTHVNGLARTIMPAPGRVYLTAEQLAARDNYSSLEPMRTYQLFGAKLRANTGFPHRQTQLMADTLRGLGYDVSQLDVVTRW